MGKIIDFFKQWDKLAHAATSCVVMLFFTAFATLFFKYWVSIALGSLITIVYGFGKEGLDAMGLGTASWNDLLADGIGWLVALIPLILIGI